MTYQLLIGKVKKSATKKNSMRLTGFTFIEILVTLTILALLTTIALPSYQQYVTETRRSDAYIALTLAAAEQERAFAINSRYLADIKLLGGEQSPEKFYNVAVEVAGAGYRLTATAMPEGEQASDIACLQMTLDHLGVKLPANCWK